MLATLARFIIMRVSSRAKYQKTERVFVGFDAVARQARATEPG
jgi:hypothetical protein